VRLGGLSSGYVYATGVVLDVDVFTAYTFIRD
jgi:hypothetical protein